MAPDCHKNMAIFGQQECRIGQNAELLYSGTTIFIHCAHSHRNDNNMVGGCTAIVTLTKAGRCDQEKEVVTGGDTQCIILPLYKPAGVMTVSWKWRRSLRLISNLGLIDGYLSLAKI